MALRVSTKRAGRPVHRGRVWLFQCPEWPFAFRQKNESNESTAYLSSESFNALNGPSRFDRKISSTLWCPCHTRSFNALNGPSRFDLQVAGIGFAVGFLFLQFQCPEWPFAFRPLPDLLFDITDVRNPLRYHGRSQEVSMP